MIEEIIEYAAGKAERRVRAGSRSARSTIDIAGIAQASSRPEHAWWQAVLRGVRVEVQRENPLQVVDLFCGTGGLTLGASLAVEAVGLTPVPTAAVDLDADALQVYRHNFSPSVAINGNVASMIDYHVYGRGSTAALAYRPELLSDGLSLHAIGADILLAGPPCQGHSNLNNHTRRSDPRNLLYVCVAAAAIALHAKMVVIENVPDVIADRTEVVSTARRILMDAGYYVSQSVLKASSLGGAQTRRRHFTIATQRPHAPVEEVARSLSKPAMTLRQAIGDLEQSAPRSFMDEVPVLSAENQDRVNYLFNHDAFDLPDDVRPDCHKNGHTYPSVYGRLHWDQPSPTITTGFMTPGRGRFIHPSQRRVITPREAARVQGFPDSFVFAQNESPLPRKLLAKWIGDAVPTQLGYVAVLTALTSL